MRKSGLDQMRMPFLVLWALEERAWQRRDRLEEMVSKDSFPSSERTVREVNDD